jgi:hypothetical protein
MITTAMIKRAMRPANKALAVPEEDLAAPRRRPRADEAMVVVQREVLRKGETVGRRIYQHNNNNNIIIMIMAA